jgi:hypothetical protein
MGKMGSGSKPPDRLQQSQIIGRIHLHHFGVNQICAKYTSLRIDTFWPTDYNSQGNEVMENLTFGEIYEF